MATTLDFSKFAFTTEQIRDINELVFDDIINAPEISLVCTIYPGIVFSKEVGFIGEGAPVGKAGQGCEPEYQNWKIGTRVVTWEPKNWGIYLKECYKDLEQTAAVYSLNKGIRIADFTDTDYYAIIARSLADAIKKFIIRMVWFSDEDADNVSEGGVITDGVDLDLFKILPAGLFKQAIAQTVTNPKQLVTISKNANATYGTQELVPSEAAEILRNLKYQAPIVLRGKTNAFIACTQSVYDAWEQYNQGKELESLYANLIDGTKVLKAFGIPLIPMPIWDEMIYEFENTGTRLNRPHRAIYYQKETMGVAVDAETSLSDFKTWYEEKEEIVYTKAKGKADTKILNPTMFQIAI